jgi:hypothetical protein
MATHSSSACSSIETQIKFHRRRGNTSEYIPPLPTNSFKSAARLSPAFSSSILLLQSSLPVQIRTCSAYGAIVPLSGFV